MMRYCILKRKVISSYYLMLNIFSSTHDEVGMLFQKLMAWLDDFGGGYLWMFPKIVVMTPQFIPFLIGFSIKKHLFWGVSLEGEHPYLEINSFINPRIFVDFRLLCNLRNLPQVYVYIGDTDVNDVDGSLLGRPGQRVN